MPIHADPLRGLVTLGCATVTAVRVLLFDVDGTLIRAGGAGMRAMDDAFHEIYGVRGAAAAIRPDGMTDPAIVRDMLAAAYQRVPSGGEVERMLEVYLARLDERMASADLRVLPGLPAVLDSARARGDLLGLATGNLEAGARIKLRRAGLDGYFGFGGFACDHEDRVLLTRRGVERARERAADAEVVVIGDTPRDVAAARGAGARALAVATGRYTVDELQRTGADAVMATLEGLDGVLAAL